MTTTEKEVLQYWYPKDGGWVYYRGPIREYYNDLCLVLDQDVDSSHGRFRRVLLASLHNGRNQFYATSNECYQIAILVIRRNYAYCSSCGQRCANKESAFRCRHCGETFVGVSDPYEGQFFSVADIRKDWPIKVIPFRTMELSCGGWDDYETEKKDRTSPRARGKKVNRDRMETV